MTFYNQQDLPMFKLNIHSQTPESRHKQTSTLLLAMLQILESPQRFKPSYYKLTV